MAIDAQENEDPERVCVDGYYLGVSLSTVPTYAFGFVDQDVKVALIVDYLPGDGLLFELLLAALELQRVPDSPEAGAAEPAAAPQKDKRGNRKQASEITDGITG